jgi:N6-L-threonylcarbamoyladenine synthase
MSSPLILLAIESSCDETSAAVSSDRNILSNLIATQKIHETFGGVVPELASRAHQLHILPVVTEALRNANISKKDLHGIAFTRGPGLMGSLLVGASFAKSLSAALHIPLIEVNHMQAHVLAHFIESDRPCPPLPFLCLTVSGGHTQIVRVYSHDKMEIIGETLDDAAGEAFDKTARILGLPYPGGPLVDQWARKGNPFAFRFTTPHAPGYHFSFSGLKTAILYKVRDELKKDPGFIDKNLADLCASVQQTIVGYLLQKLFLAARETGISDLAIAGGVSANSGLREQLEKEAASNGYNIYIPEFQYCTDNAAMIAIAGYYKFLQKDFTDLSVSPMARMEMVKSIK